MSNLIKMIFNTFKYSKDLIDFVLENNYSIKMDVKLKRGLYNTLNYSLTNYYTPLKFLSN